MSEDDDRRVTVAALAAIRTQPQIIKAIAHVSGVSEDTVHEILERMIREQERS
jgi:DNA-binding IclR family transcriptional regulator